MPGRQWYRQRLAVHDSAGDTKEAKRANMRPKGEGIRGFEQALERLESGHRLQVDRNLFGVPAADRW